MSDLARELVDGCSCDCHEPEIYEGYPCRRCAQWHEGRAAPAAECERLERLVAEKDAEIARLREALRSIAEDPPTAHPYATIDEILDEKLEIAKRAIGTYIAEGDHP